MPPGERRREPPISAEDLKKVGEVITRHLDDSRTANEGLLEKFTARLEEMAQWQQDHHTKHLIDDDKIFGKPYGINPRLERTDEKVSKIERVWIKITGAAAALWTAAGVILWLIFGGRH